MHSPLRRLAFFKRSEEKRLVGLSPQGRGTQSFVSGHQDSHNRYGQYLGTIHMVFYRSLAEMISLKLFLHHTKIVNIIPELYK